MTTSTNVPAKPDTTSQQSAGYRVAFDAMADIKPMTFPADTTATHITARLHSAFLAADAIDDGHVFNADVNFEAGTVNVYADGDVIEYGSIHRLEPPPDYWQSLAANLRQAADRIATLAGQPKPPYAALGINFGDPGNKVAGVADRVDVIAAAFGVTAETKRSPGGYYERSAGAQMGQLRLSFYGYVPNPEESELERLRAENAALRAAQGGTR